MNGTFYAARADVRRWIKLAAGLPKLGLIRQAPSMDADAVRDYQTRRFRELYARARAEVPYYRDRPRDYPEMPAGIPAEEFLRRLPILDKSTVRAETDAFYSTRKSLTRSYHCTSGTTGSAVKLAADAFERGFHNQILRSLYRGIAGGGRLRTMNLTGFVNPSETDDIYWTSPLTGTTYVSIFALKEANRDILANLIRKHRPNLLYGYASAVFALARLLGDEFAQSRDERVAVVTSEVLLPGWRETMEASLFRRVFNQYSSLEGAHLAFECECGAMHVHPLVGIVELLGSRGEPVAAGEVGEVVSTGLIREQMPLIRYALGDAAASTGGLPAHCPCGLSWTTIGEVAGRSDDLIQMRDGRRLGYVMRIVRTVSKEIPGIEESQLVQTGYESFRFHLVLRPEALSRRRDIERRLKDELEKILRIGVRLEYRYMDAIPRVGRNKYKFIVVEKSEAASWN